MEIKRSGSQISSKGPVDWFTGTVRIDSLFEASEPARVRGASVTFEPGARTAWHTHPLGQTLIVTSGAGRVQYVCYCPPDVSSSQAVKREGPRSPRRSRNEAARRAEILAAAIDRFGRNGYDEHEMGGHCGRCRHRPTALYHYFDSKQHCLYVIIEQALKDLHGAIRRDHGDPCRPPARRCVPCAPTPSSSPSATFSATESSSPNRLC